MQAVGQDIGLTGNDALLEVKCPISGKDMNLEEVVNKNKGFILRQFKNDKNV